MVFCCGWVWIARDAQAPFILRIVAKRLPHRCLHTGARAVDWAGYDSDGALATPGATTANLTRELRVGIGGGWRGRRLVHATHLLGQTALLNRLAGARVGIAFEMLTDALAVAIRHAELLDEPPPMGRENAAQKKGPCFQAGSTALPDGYLLRANVLS
jgi:hypothetical protein